MNVSSALPSRFLAPDLSGAVRSVASSPVEDEDGTDFAADLDRLARVGALVEQVAAWLRIVVGNPFADGLARWLDGLEGLIRPPRLAGSPCGLRLRVRPKRLRSLGVFRCRRTGRVMAGWRCSASRPATRSGGAPGSRTRPRRPMRRLRCGGSCGGNAGRGFYGGGGAISADAFPHAHFFNQKQKPRTPFGHPGFCESGCCAGYAAFGSVTPGLLARAAFAFSTSTLKAASSSYARPEMTLRSSVIPAALMPSMNRL